MIFNAKDKLLNENTGTLPDVSGALLSYFQPMSFTKITKTIENFQTVEKARTINFKGVIQPFTPEQLKIKPEGQWSWNWNMVHADPSCVLSTDDVITYLNVQYRVMAKIDYSRYGYVEYHIIADYQGVSP